MKHGNILRYTLPLSALIAISAIALPSAALAGRNYKGEKSCCSLPVTPWYIGGNIGVSHLFDKKTTATTNSVNQNGPGWNVNGGYQYNRTFGVELGFNQYHKSRETTSTTEVATTEHYAAYLAATGKYPLVHRVQALGKLGAAYSYANKVFNTGAGSAAAANSGSLYFGLGVIYNLTRRTDVIAQWSRALGNDTTGSADLYTIGVSLAVI